MTARLVALALLDTSLLACGGAQEPKNEDPCADVELDVERVWSAEIRAEVVGYGGEVAGMTREAIATRMDGVSRDWAMLRRSACRDHFVRHLLSAEELAAKNRCLDRTLQAQRTLVASLRARAPNVEVSEIDSVSETLEGCR